MTGKRVVLASAPGASVDTAEVALRATGYATSRAETLDELHRQRTPAGPPDLVIVDADFEGDGVQVCKALRQDPAWRKVSLMLIARAGDPRLQERPVPGVNDFILEPVSAPDLADKAHRLTVIPTRREVNTLARVYDRQRGGSLLGKTLNISLNGILLEVEGPVGVGRTVEIEFFLPDDPEPLRVHAKVIRQALELELIHPAFGLRFEAMPESERDRIDDFIRQRERAVSRVRELRPGCSE